MSTAPIDSVSFTHANSERAGWRWERLLAVASVCLPIPLLAATGLSIPLPAGVERIGAALVAWAEEGADASPLAESGSIVLADFRQAAPEPRDEVAGAVRAAASHGLSPADGGSSGSSGQKDADNKGTGGSAGSGSGGSGGSNGSGGDVVSPPPAAEPGLVEGTVKDVTGAVDPVVDGLDDTLGGVGKTVDDLLPTDDPLGLGDGLLGPGK